MVRWSDLYIAALVVVAVPVLYLMGRNLQPSLWPFLLSLTAASTIFILLRIEGPNGQTFTVNSAVHTISLLVGGPALGVWVASIGHLAAAMLIGSDWRRTLFNTAQMVITLGLSGYFYGLVAGITQVASINLLAALAAVGTYLLTNTLLVAGLFALLQAKPFFTVWANMLRQGLETFLIVQAIGLVSAFLILKGGAWSLVLIGLLALLQRVLSSYNASLRQNAEAGKRQAVQDSLLVALVATLDARDLFTSGHSGRVAHYAELIAEQMRLPEARREAIRYASLLHDIGKIGIPDSILRKDGALTPTERAIMMEHPERGVQILANVLNIPDVVRQTIRHHHEWVNGGGYPSGLQGEEIPQEARIIAVADALDAMTSGRPYRDGLPWVEAMNRLRQGRSTQFDPDVVDAMMAVSLAHPELKQETEARGRPSLSSLEHQLDTEQRNGHPEPPTGRILPAHSMEIKILYQMALERRSLLDLSQTLHRTLEILYDAIGNHKYYIMLLDEAGIHLSIRATAGGESGLPSVPWPADLGFGHPSVRNGHALLVADTQNESVTTAHPDTRSLLAVPLQSRTGVLGVLRIESVHPGAFGQEETYLLTAVARQVADAIEVAKVHEQMTYAATHDGLTGALNRSTFYQRLEGQLAAFAGGWTPLSVVILDLDHFKAINDTYGHLVGDKALREFSHHLREGLPPTAAVARYGGDEFAVILPGYSKAAATTAMVKAVRRCTFTIPAGKMCFPCPSASWGLATFPDEGRTAEELVYRADEHLYRNKRDVKDNAVEIL